VSGRRGTAVVLGASMAGLLAARVLAESFDRVTVLDRDTVLGVRESRRGAPHTRHAHGLRDWMAGILEWHRHCARYTERELLRLRDGTTRSPFLPTGLGTAAVRLPVRLR